MRLNKTTYFLEMRDPGEFRPSTRQLEDFQNALGNYLARGFKIIQQTEGLTEKSDFEPEEISRLMSERKVN